MIDGEDACGSEQPGGLHGKEAHRAAAEDHHGLAALDLPHLGSLIPGGEDVAEEEDLLLIHVVGNLHRSDVGERHAHVLRLATLVAAGDVGIPVHPARHVAVRVRVLAIRGEAARAIEAAAAGDVERHHHPVATT